MKRNYNKAGAAEFAVITAFAEHGREIFVSSKYSRQSFRTCRSTNFAQWRLIRISAHENHPPNERVRYQQWGRACAGAKFSARVSCKVELNIHYYLIG
jgi:hypothetical protein